MLPTCLTPLSVGKFFIERKFKNYWFSTGTSSFLVKQMQSNPFQLEAYTKEWMPPMFIDKFDATTLNPLALALQMGYLTIAEVQADEYGESCRYDFPNEEIRMSWYDALLGLVSSNYMELTAGRRKLYDGMKTGNIDQMMLVLKALFAGVAKENVGEIREGYYRNMMYMLFTAFGVNVHAEEQVAGGRVDIVAETYGRAYVFELKVCKTETRRNVEKLLSEGIDQAVRCHYVEKYKFNAEALHVISIVFDNKTHRLVAWRAQGETEKTALADFS